MPPERPVLVIGGGAAGQRAALDLLGVGLPVVMVERAVTLGGTVSQLGVMFPGHDCLLCRGSDRHGTGCTRPTLSPDLLDRSWPDGLQVLTRSRVTAASGEPGDFRVTVRTEPRYVDPARCISCDRCTRACPKTMADPLEAGLVSRKAAYRPSERAVPDAYAIDKGPWCEGCGACVAACPTGAVHLDEQPRDRSIRAAAIVLASGMRLHEAATSAEYGWGRYPNVFTGLEMERMCSPAGPGEGRIARRSDGAAPARIAWLQCVGSRDQDHDYCSAFCCGYATRQAVLARRILPSAEARILMMDDRVFARGFSGTYDPLRRQHGITLQRCRASVISEDPSSRELLVQVDGDDGRVSEERFDMVVLSVGATAAAEAADLARMLGLQPDAFGFVRTGAAAPVDSSRPGIFVAGTAAGPADLADCAAQAGAAAARVVATLRRRVRPAVAPVRAPAASAAPARIGVFLCDCAGEIGSVLPVEEILRLAARLPAVARSEAVPFACLAEGLERLQAARREGELTDVVIGACNRRTYTALFERGLGARVEVVSLREGCAWVHADDPAGAAHAAKELVRLAVERARRAAGEPAAEVLAPDPAALVVGGGLAGLTAALHLADAGVRTHLVEREASLGGNALLMDRTPDGVDVPAMVAGLARRASSHPRISVHLGSTVRRMGSYQGRFTAVVRAGGPHAPEAALAVGAAVIATGATGYEGGAYRTSSGDDQVITLLELTGRLRRDPGLPSRTAGVVFIGCVGPWDEPGSGACWRCSRSCCETMTRHARRFREVNPACRVAVLVREVNTYGFREEDYTAARKAGVLFVRFAPDRRPRVEGGTGGARVTVVDVNLGEELELEADLVVLAAAVLPRPDSPEAAAALGIRLGADGYPRQWETKTRPTATLEPGVFACGLANGPMPMREAVAQGLAAAQGALVHLSQVRVVSLGEVAAVDTARCARCLTCVRVCPYGVPRIAAAGFPPGWPRAKPYIDPARCQGCGVCVAECPARAIEFGRFGDEALSADGALGRWAAGAEA